ncbi:MAG: hypothetical protein QF664_06750 [Dehalococcoidia bacterium]|jgi:hypothetical protein|nr:hypothetical protein [Dehalococcoidia bacterium]
MSVRTSVRRSNLIVATASAIIGFVAIALTLAQGGGTVGYVLGVVLLANGYARYRLAQRE